MGHEPMVLIVDDDQELQETLAVVLRASRYKVQLASNGAGALEALKRHPVDLVISDLQMFGGDGVSFLKEASNCYPHIPVVIFTGLYVSEEELKAQGAHSLLNKPCTNRELFKTIQEALGSKAVTAAA